MSIRGKETEVEEQICRHIYHYREAQRQQVEDDVMRCGETRRAPMCTEGKTKKNKQKEK